jgi:PhnB protein
MSDTQPHTDMPEPATLAPHLVCGGAMAAIDFYKTAFGAREVIRLAGPDGKLMHACLDINGGQVMLAEERADCGAMSPKTLHGTPVTINLRVADADAVFDRAVRAGATPVMPPTDMFWGDRYGMLEDPFGHRWAVMTTQRVLSEAELREAAADFQAAMQG